MRFPPLVAILLINCSTLERAEYGNTRIRKIVIDNGTVTTLAGSS